MAQECEANTGPAGQPPGTDGADAGEEEVGKVFANELPVEAQCSKSSPDI